MCSAKSSAYNLRNNNSLQLCNSRTNFGLHSFRHICAKLWNDLPHHVKTMSDLSDLKEFLSDNFTGFIYEFSYSCYVMLCCVVLCFVVLCCVVLCYVMLCYVMLCYVMLCYVMLCYVTNFNKLCMTAWEFLLIPYVGNR